MQHTLFFISSFFVFIPIPSASPARHQLIIADFGFAVRVQPGQKLTEWWGSLHYSAPEILSRQPYGAGVDIWSAGVVLYAWTAGRLPFGGNEEAIIARATQAVYTEPQHFSSQLRDLLRRIFVVDPTQRISVAEIQTHPCT